LQNPLRAAAPGRGRRDRRLPRGGLHGDDKAAPPFHSVGNNAYGAGGPITSDGVYKVLAGYAGIVGIDVDGFGPHALRATAPMRSSTTRISRKSRTG
jgi:integrase